MSTFAAKLKGAGLVPPPAAAQGAKQRASSGGAPAQAAKPAKQTVGFAVANSTDRLSFIGNVLIGYRVEVQVSRCRRRVI
jgi:hypothetical protein